MYTNCPEYGVPSGIALTLAEKFIVPEKLIKIVSAVATSGDKIRKDTASAQLFIVFIRD